MSAFTDETLIAFLDGVLPEPETAAVAAALENDPALAAHLEGLQVDFAPITAEFDALLAQAPVFEVPALSNVVELRPKPATRWIHLAIAASIALVIGFGFGRNTAPTPEPAPLGWLAAVANYQNLYNPDTLWGMKPTPEQAEKEVVRVAKALEHDLSLAQLQVAGLTYRRGQILTFRGKPLAQFMFNDAEGTPIAICMIKSAKDDTALAVKQIDGLNAAVWTDGGYGYLVIGDTDADILQRAAEQLQVQI